MITIKIAYIIRRFWLSRRSLNRKFQLELEIYYSYIIRVALFYVGEAILTRQQPMVLLVDDDRDMRWAMRNILADAGFDVAEAEAGGTGLELASRRTPAAVLLDMRMPGLGGEEVLRGLRRLDPGLPVIVVTAHGTISGAVSAIREGAFEYVTKPFRNEHLVETVRRAVARRTTAGCANGSGIRAALTAAMGQGPAIQTLAAQAEAVVSTDYSVIIKGETGAGKEVVARNLHEHGRAQIVRLSSSIAAPSRNSHRQRILWS